MTACWRALKTSRSFAIAHLIDITAPFEFAREALESRLGRGQFGTPLGQIRFAGLDLDAVPLPESTFGAPRGARPKAHPLQPPWSRIMAVSESKGMTVPKQRQQTCCERIAKFADNLNDHSELGNILKGAERLNIGINLDDFILCFGDSGFRILHRSGLRAAAIE